MKSESSFILDLCLVCKGTITIASISLHLTIKRIFDVESSHLRWQSCVVALP